MAKYRPQLDRWLLRQTLADALDKFPFNTMSESLCHYALDQRVNAGLSEEELHQELLNHVAFVLEHTRWALEQRTEGVEEA